MSVSGSCFEFTIMETSRKTRTRSKSNSASSDTEPSTLAEKENIQDPAANVNGDSIDDTAGSKDTENIENNEPDTKDTDSAPVTGDTDKESEKDQETKPTETSDSKPKEKLAKNRKRKASEMKSGDESPPEEGSKEKKSNSEVVNETTEAESNEIENPENEIETEKGSAEKVPETMLSESEIKVEKEELMSESDISLRLSLSESDITLPPKQTLGKGKRARIPNKRYSDILLSPHHRPKLENGSDSESSLNVTQEVTNSPVVTIKSTRTTNSPLPIYKKTKAPIDISNPNFLKPFKYGWKRELVWRATFDASQKRSGDIYYYTPTGKKVRSMREVSENLKNKELTLEDFTFTKEAIGLDDPEKEIIRDAKYKAGSGMAKKLMVKKASIKTPTKISSPKLASPKVTSPRPTTPKSAANETADSPPKNTKGNAKSLGNFKIKLPAKKAEKKKSEEEMEPEAPPVKQAPTTTSTRRSGKWANFNSEKPCQPCSIRCHGVQGIIPTLQCRHCLCLYHHECVGAAPHMSLTYVCKNCHLDGQSTNQTTPTPPPLTPINTLKSVNVPSSVLPKLQRIPRNEEENVELPRLTPRPENVPPVAEIVNKSLVGSVTTWLPHNSKIVDNFQRHNDEPHDTIRPQYLEILAGRKFLVIPKHNFMTVSPTVAATATRNDTLETPLPSVPDDIVEPENIPMDSASLGPTVDSIKVEPQSPSKPEKSHTPEVMEVDPPTEEKPQSPVTDMDCDEKPADVGVITKDENPEPAPESPPKAKKRLTKLNNSVATLDKNIEGKFMDHYLQNLSYGYNTLLYVFQYLKVQDLLRAGCVCTMWRDIASHSMLWRTVRMKNSQVHSFEGLANTLKKHGTSHLDLRKMLLPSGGDEIWPQFSKAIERVDTLRKIELCRCPAAVVEQLAVSNPHLEVINAVTIKCENMSLEPFASLKNIKELRLKSTGGLTLTSNIDSLKFLTTLKHLSLTSIRDLHAMNLSVIAELTSLESLDLGECSDFPKNFGEEILVKLVNLEKLRLEKGQGNCHTFEILDAVKNMKHLEQLELVNFDIKAGFDKSLGTCFNIKKLLIIPTYISQSATTNHMVLGGVLRLHKTLSHFVWGVTLELLRVTELFVDQCEEPVVKDKKEKKPVGNGDSIPVLKPVPLITEKDSEIPPAHDPPQVEILPLPNLQKLLLQSLPTTRVKILKIPFHATWRQSITDSVN